MMVTLRGVSVTPLQTQLEETEVEALMAQKNADVATRERDALETQLGEVTERAQLAHQKC